MNEETMITLQELQYAVKNVGGFDFGDFNFDTIQGALNYIEELEKENEKLNDFFSKEKRTHVDMNMVELFLEAKNKPKPKTKIGEISGVEVYITPSQKNEYIKTLIETEYISKQKIRDKIEHLKSYKGLVMYEKYNYEAIIRHLEELLEEEK